MVMAQNTLEERVRALEETVAAIVADRTAKPKKDWRSTIGMFKNDPVFAEIQEEGRKIREADRHAAGQDANDDPA
jgi:hypothetical protein